ncbi:MAG: hypothetical protein ACUVUC_12435 [Thermoguttaceae bacterium]
MSPRNSENPAAGPYRKPQPDIYTVMLLVALLALIIGTVFLYLEVRDYGPQPFAAASGGAGILPVLLARAAQPPVLPVLVQRELENRAL